VTLFRVPLTRAAAGAPHPLLSRLAFVIVTPLFSGHPRSYFFLFFLSFPPFPPSPFFVVVCCFLRDSEFFPVNKICVFFFFPPRVFSPPEYVNSPCLWVDPDVRSLQRIQLAGLFLIRSQELSLDPRLVGWPPWLPTFPKMFFLDYEHTYPLRFVVGDSLGVPVSF